MLLSRTLTQADKTSSSLLCQIEYLQSRTCVTLGLPENLPFRSSPVQVWKAVKDSKF